jgi:adenylate cyclase
LASVAVVATSAALAILFAQGLRGPDLAISALLFGLPSALWVALIERTLYPGTLRLPFLAGLVLRVFLLGVALIVGFAIAAWLANLRFSSPRPTPQEAWVMAVRSLFLPQVQQGIGFVFTALVIYSAMEQLSRRLGPGVLGNLVLGRYHRPRTEERLFMFIDMTDSTGLAERLGDLAYSALLRDFFNDMTEAILETDATVVHYVGDEVVLTWPMALGLKAARPVRCFLLAKQALDNRAARYQARYGLRPAFKAAIHGGSVVVTEVGELKTETVYHGDVLNATARMLSLCSELKRDLLISEEVGSRLRGLPKGFLVTEGSYAVRGKELPLDVLSLSI